MAQTPALLASLLSTLYQCVRRVLKSGVISLALAPFFRGFRFLWSVFGSRCSRGEVGGKKGGNIGPARTEKSDGEDSKERNRWPEAVKNQYAVKLTGETVTLDEEVAYSLSRIGGIRNASRSSPNLDASRTADQAVYLRSGSQSSLGTHSSSSSFHSALDVEEKGSITIVIQPTSLTSSSSPALVPRYPASLPNLNNPQDEPQNPLQLQIESLEHSQPSQITERSDVIASQKIDRTTLDIASITSTQRPCLDIARIIPIMPEHTERYTRRPRIKSEWTYLIIQPLTLAYEKPIPPSGWTRYIHPEGARYFFNKEKRVYTEADIFDPKIYLQLMDDIRTLETFVADNNVTLPAGTHLILDLYCNSGDPDNIISNYYYVHHESRIIVFLDNYEADSLPSWYKISGVKNEVHLRHEVEAQYWYFLQLYPHSRALSKPLCSELRDIVHFFIGDEMTSPTSTSPFISGDLYKIVTLLDSLEHNIDGCSVGSIALLSRLMYMFVHSRFLNFYGEAHARIERDVSVHGHALQRTWLIKCLSIFLFLSPNIHLRTLYGISVDGIVNRSVWEQWMKKIKDEWQQFVLLATVMLNANVAFLAIQSVDINDNPRRSPAQISSYLSVVASIGSILLGVLLIKQNSTIEVQRFIAQRSNPNLRLETLAILFSFPYAFLMWGIVSFLTAFLLMCLQSSNAATRSSVTFLSFTIVVLIFWCVWAFWEGHRDQEAVEPRDDQNDDVSSKHSAIPNRSFAATLFSKFWSC